MEGPPLGPGGEDISWPDQVAPRGRKASSTRKFKPQTSNLMVPKDHEFGRNHTFPPYAFHSCPSHVGISPCMGKRAMRMF